MVSVMGMDSANRWEYYRAVIKPSSIHLILTVVLLILVVCCSWTADLPWYVSGILSLVSGFIVAWTLYHRVLLRSVNSITQIAYQRGRWQIKKARGGLFYTCLTGEIFITPWLVTFWMQEIETRKKYPVIIFFDAVSPEEHRRLRVLLRINESHAGRV